MKAFQVVSKSPKGISACLCSGWVHSRFSTPWCRLVSTNHLVPANSSLGLIHSSVRCSYLSSVGGPLSAQWGVRRGMNTPLPSSESCWVTWLLKQHTGLQGPSRTAYPQLLTLSSPLPTPTLLLTSKLMLFSHLPPLPHPTFHRAPLVGDGSKLVTQTRPRVCQHFLLPPWSPSFPFPGQGPLYPTHTLSSSQDCQLQQMMLG